jgi:hypothetical protein
MRLMWLQIKLQTRLLMILQGRSSPFAGPLPKATKLEHCCWQQLQCTAAVSQQCQVEGHPSKSHQNG